MGATEYLKLAFTHPNELRSLLQYAVWHEPRRNIEASGEHATSGFDRQSMRDCWSFLDLTSRSFAAVIKELDGDLARVICLFYLALRGLDTVEDDMTIPNSVKLPLLRSFHEKLLTPGWNFNGNSDKEKDKPLLVKFDCVVAEMGHLSPGDRDVIVDITRKMGAGMADFCALATEERPVAEVAGLEEFNLYCHYVAGLVGEGLSRLFVSTEKERPFLAEQLVLSNSMGLLLQKTNILRDIKEDVDCGRGFWPRSVFSSEEFCTKLGQQPFKELTDVVNPKNAEQGLWVMNAMIVDALSHATDSLDYLSFLRNQSVFNFCAIPAVMALATLELCYNNPNVLKQNVKIRKGQAVQLIMRATNPRDVAHMFRDYARKIHAKSTPKDPSFVKISITCGKIEQWTEHYYPTFISVTPASNGPAGQASSGMDEGTLDARIRIAKAKKIADVEKDTLRRQRKMDKYRLSKGLPLKKVGEVEASSNMDWLILFGVLLGLLVVMGGMGGLIAWVVIKMDNTSSLR